jgi:plastocyanin
MRTRTLRAAIAALAIPAMLGACGGDDDAQTTSTSGTGGSGDTTTVILKGLAYKPDKIEIGVGETVTWEWDDGSIAHNVVGKGFKSELTSSGTFEHTFEKAGEYDYLCTVHPTMKGIVTVK